MRGVQVGEWMKEAGGEEGEGGGAEVGEEDGIATRVSRKKLFLKFSLFLLTSGANR